MEYGEAMARLFNDIRTAACVATHSVNGSDRQRIALDALCTLVRETGQSPDDASSFHRVALIASGDIDDQSRRASILVRAGFPDPTR